MSAASDTQPGVWSSLKRILDTLLATAQNRIELIAVELQEEKCRLMEAPLCGVAVGRTPRAAPSDSMVLKPGAEERPAQLDHAARGDPQECRL
jgi:hypothetical protein